MTSYPGSVKEEQRNVSTGEVFYLPFVRKNLGKVRLLEPRTA